MRYKLLGRSGLRVSELALGTMTFGDAWVWGADRVRQQDRGSMIPIVGARTEAQIREDLAALDFELTPEALERLDNANRLDLGFPDSFLASDGVRSLIFGETFDLIDRTSA